VLARAGYTEQGIQETFGLERDWPFVREEPQEWLRRAGGDGPLEALIRLFFLGAPVETHVAQQALEPTTIDQWAEAGLIRPQDSSVRATVQLAPFRGMVLACDLPSWTGAVPRPDHVLGISPATVSLANMIVSRPSALMLDVGTGCGVLALLTAGQSARVVATDVSLRALRFAAFNARLNGIANVEWLAASLLDPFRGRAFDLIASNPPFVISPERRYVCRDSGLPGDRVVEAVVRQTAASLCEGGYGQILCNWAHVRGQGLRERLADWLDGAGCDAWAIRAHTMDPAAYARSWAPTARREDPDEQRRRVDDWLAYYAREQIEAISAGLITLRRRSAAANWFRMDDAPEQMFGPATRDDERLLALRLRPSPRLRVQDLCRRTGEARPTHECTLRLDWGLAYSEAVDPDMAHLVTECDGQRRLADVLPEAPSPACLAVVRHLVERGFLVPAEDEASGA